MDVEDDFVHTDILMEIIGDHPHRGEFGHPVGKSKDTITVTDLCGPNTYLIHLINCEHGTDRCYAEKKKLRLLKGGKK